MICGKILPFHLASAPHNAEAQPPHRQYCNSYTKQYRRNRYCPFSSFAELLDFVREARFERLGAFKYSEEEGTYGAENFNDRTSAKVKQERLDELMTLQSEISMAFNQSRVGSEIDVIVDDYSDGVFVCRSEFESPEVDGEILVRYDSSVMGDVDPYSLVGEFIKVRVIGADEYDLIAEPLEI